MIRPPDPVIQGPPLRFMPIRSHEAVRRLAHLAFRDAHSALDLTYLDGAFWRDPLPPGLTITGNNLDPASGAALHLDFTGTGLSDGSYDLVVIDPPHVADAGASGIMGTRYGTVRGAAALRELIEAGCREAWRIADVGMLVKVADHAHQGQEQPLSDWVKAAIPMLTYNVLHTYRPTYLRDGKHRATRVPRNNGATYLAFRKSGPIHIDFERLYERQARKGAAA
jgi:hypothetical protein